MFIYTFKASSIKFFAVLVLSIFALIAFVSLTAQYADPNNTITTFSSIRLSNNEERVIFLKENGVNVEEVPCEIVEIEVPKNFDSAYQEYNQIQKAQGFDLEKYQGKNVTRYSYIVEDSSDEKVIANIIIYKNKIIAGDICCTEGGGFVSKLIK